MRKLSKLLVLVLSLALLVGSVFVVGALAADDDGLGIEGAERTHLDFTNVVYDRHNKENGGTAANPTTMIGTHPIAEMVLGKYGHLRTVKSPIDDNTWYEWLFEKDNTTGATDHDSVLCIESNLSVANYSYYIQEFDMTTRTNFPGNMQILFESRAWRGSTEYNSGNITLGDTALNYRSRNALAQYNAAEGVWKAGSKSFAVEANEWVHVTIVYKIVADHSTTADGTALVNYGKTTANLYINGELYNSLPAMTDLSIYADSDARIYYCGLGYGYGTQHNGTKADDGIIIDNVTKTYLTSAYAADVDNDDLAALFATENRVTDVTDISPAIVWGEDYELPETEVGVAAYVPEEGEEYVAANIEQALQMLKDDENEGATIKLYANRYNSVHIDYPCVIDLNGFTLQNEYTCTSDLKATYDTVNGCITFEYDAENSAIFTYYNAPYANIAGAKAVKTQVVVAGNTFTPLFAGSDLYPITVDGKTAYAPVGIGIYDENGNKVTITEITDSEKGKSFSVCPELETLTFANDIVFYYLKHDGTVTFYDTTDLMAAKNADGVIEAGTIVMLKDATYSAVIQTAANSTLKIDLGGNTLSANKAVSQYVSSFGGMAIYFYSSKEGGKIDTQSAPLLNVNAGVGNQMGHGWYFGHVDLETQSPYRLEIKCSTSVGYVQKGSAQYIYLANSDIYVANGVSSTGVFGLQQARVPQYFQLWNCNLFTDGVFFTSGGNTATCTVTIKDSNIYGGGRTFIGYIASEGAGACDGITSFIFENSKVYNLDMGQTAVAKWQLKMTMDEKTVVSFAPDMSRTTLPAGYELLTAPDTQVIDGVKYVATYAPKLAGTKYATFNVYGVTIDKLTADTPILGTYKVAIGYWFESATAPQGDSTFDPAIDPNNALTPSGYAFYDKNGNLLNKTTLEDSDAGETFNVCVNLAKTPVTFYMQLADGSYVPYTTNELSKVAIPEGATIVLNTDCIFTSAITLNNNKIDLNGNTLYTLGKGPQLVFNGGKTSFIYSSKEGGAINGVPETQKGGNLFDIGKNAVGYIGYVDAETFSPYAITISSDSFIQAWTQNATLNMQGLSIVGNGKDNYAFFCARGDTTSNINYNFLNCTLLVENRGILISSRGGASNINVTFTNTNIYFNVGNGRPVFRWYDEATNGKASITFDNSSVYGSFQFDELTKGTATCTVYVKGNCQFSAFSDAIIVEDGYTCKTAEELHFFAGITVPKNGMYGNDPFIYGWKKDYPIAYVISAAPAFDANAYKAQAYQNMTLDTNVVGNLYIPVDAAKVLSVTYGGNNIFDETAIEIINGKEYYVITVEVAPKYGNLTATVTVSLEGGNTVDFAFSVANYAKALLALDGTNNAYVADSQTMMKYVLAYIKEVAVAFGGADANLFADLGDIAVDINKTVTEEVKNTAAINTYVTHAALDLDAYAGFAFKVAAGFVGTVRVEMAGVEAVEKTYTAEAPAGEMEVLVLENVPAYLFRGDVTITATPAEGEAVTAQFNLATYVTANADEAYAKALYAYTVEAAAYNTKYPTVNTVN